MRPSPHGTLSAWRSCGSAAWLSRTASSCTARPSWGAAVRAPDGSIRVGLRHQAAFRAERDDALRPRPAAARRGVRRPPGRAARAARGTLPLRAAARRGRGRRRCRGGGHRPPLAARARRPRGLAAFASLAPAAIALRGGELASYHGAEHISIGTYETGEPATKEHDRCGGHLVGPLLLTSAAASALASRAPARARPAARALGAVGAVGAAVEIFGWMGRHPEHPVSRALARPGPRAAGPRLHRGAVGGPARGRRGRARRLPRGRRGGVIRAARARGEQARSERVRPPRREDAGGLLHRRVLQPHARRAARRRPPPAGR